ncbi:protein phosphatase 1A-like [Seriola lalandi dorsalis]|uniref:protein phosphatase 1A-like n=1 Tax=Seriola lalandi dorsalis TaxID=1841481 RepID=UPI000C6FBA15|nr:protein phosphatase 1A-like [Seriola lalandi dorsalis]
MGAFLDKPKMEKYNSHGEGNNLRYGLSSMQGWRVEMEDAHTAVIGLPHSLDLWSFFAVYDGHAGSQVAKYCCEHLLEHITTNSDFQSALQEDPSVDSVKNGIRTGFLQIDEHMRTISEKKHGVDRSGSTAVGVMISPSHTYFINCGDSRGLLSRGGAVHFFTQDHKPSNPLEKERIQNAGGSVMIQRVNGSLAVSRALGDFDYKCVLGKGPTEQLVSPEPEVYAIERCEGEDEFIILACDGIWDVMANEELCDFVRSRLEVTDDLERVSNEIVDTCLYKGSRDNMSVVLICFPGAPKVSPEAVKREAELDKYLEARVEGRGEKLYFAFVDHHKNWGFSIIISFPSAYIILLVQCKPHIFLIFLTLTFLIRMHKKCFKSFLLPHGLCNKSYPMSAVSGGRYDVQPLRMAHC